MILFISICVVVFFVVSYFLGNKEQKEQQTEEFLDRFQDDETAYNNAIGDVITSLQKTYVEETDPIMKFFIKAVINNFRYLRKKEYYLSLLEKFNYKFTDEEIKARARKRIREYINEEGQPVFSDITSLIDRDILAAYIDVSRAYYNLNLNMPNLHPDGYEINWSEDYFYYARVGNHDIPRFECRNEKEKRVFIYPTCAIKFDPDGAFTKIDLANVKASILDVTDVGTPSSIISIEKLDIETVSPRMTEARNFVEAFNKLHDILNKAEWERAGSEESLSKKDAEMEEILQRLDSLVGLENVKSDFREIANYIKIQQLRKLKGLKTSAINYHCVFTGNPGTGKTTLARLLADIYKQLGIVAEGQLIETDRSKLVGEYVGQTAVKTNEVVDKAIGGVLFIDEAYSLVQGSDDFGAEAIATLLKRMEDDRDKLVVILAGYGNEMKKFIDSNPGLQSRFNRYIHFADYSSDEMMEIFKRMAGDNDYILTPEAEKSLRKILEDAVKNKDENFGNARFVRNTFETVGRRQANRIARQKDISDNDLRILIPEDLIS